MIFSMGIFFFFIIIVLFLLFFASSIVFSIIRWVLSLLGIGISSTRRSGEHYDTSSTQRRGSTGEGCNESAQSSSGDYGQWHYSPEEAHKRRKRKKIISSDEGEYVDFEEIK